MQAKVGPGTLLVTNAGPRPRGPVFTGSTFASRAKRGPPMRKAPGAGHTRFAISNSAAAAIIESNADASVSAETDLVDAVFLYLTEGKYSDGCSNTRKRSIRKKAKKFVVRNGVMY